MNKLHELMERLRDRIQNPGAVEATAEDDAFLSFLHGLIRRGPNGFVVNPLASQLLDPPQLKTIDQIVKGLENAVAQHTVALSTSESGELVPTLRGGDTQRAAQLERSSGYVDEKTYWYGFKVYLSHTCVRDVKTAGVGAAAILTAAGVSSVVGAAVGAAVLALGAFDKGQGVTVSFVWPAVLVWVRSGNQI